MKPDGGSAREVGGATARKINNSGVGGTGGRIVNNSRVGVSGARKISNRSDDAVGGRNSGGFTLLEIIIVMVVFGLLVAGLSQTVRFGLAAWQAEGRLTDRQTDLEAVDRALRNVVQNLTPGDDSGNPPIAGSATSLTGVTRMRVPTSGLSATPVEVGLALSGNRLVLRWRPYLHAERLAAPPPPQEATLVGNVARIGFAYWLPKGQWSSTWSQPDLPQLIRLRISFLGDKAPSWPDLVMAPRLSRP